MKSLKQIAAEYNLYQIEDIPETHKNERFDWKIKINLKEIPEFLKTMRGIEAGLFYECRVQYKNHFGDTPDPKIVDCYYIEQSYILIKSNNSENILMLNINKGKYYLHLYYGLMRKYNVVSSYIIYDAAKQIKEPNLIGVFTEKKVQDWIEYCDKFIATNEAVLAEVNEKNKEIEDQINSFINDISGCKVERYKSSTYVKTKLFDVIFEHNKEQKYLRTKIEFKGGLADVVKIANIIN